MLKTIKFSLVAKIVAMLGPGWKSSLIFPEWYRCHSPEDLIAYYETDDLHLFMELDSANPCAAALYREDDFPPNIQLERKLIVHLAEDLPLMGWKKQMVHRLEKKSFVSTPYALPNWPQDETEGWYELLKLHAPNDLMPYFIRRIEAALKSGNFLCARDEAGIKDLLLWSLEDGVYHGLFWYSKDERGSGLRFLWQMQRYFEGQGVKSFFTQCRGDNVLSLQIHELLGYEKKSHFFLYSPD